MAHKTYNINSYFIELAITQTPPVLVHDDGIIPSTMVLSWSFCLAASLFLNTSPPIFAVSIDECYMQYPRILVHWVAEFAFAHPIGKKNRQKTA